MRALLFSIFVLFTVEGLCQVPFVQKIEPESTFPGDTIVISGNGFHDTPSNLSVWFDNVEGEIITSTEYNIKVVVPSGARASNIEVVNKVSKLSGKSLVKFIPNYFSEDFSETKFGTPLTFSAEEELWDLCNCDFDGDSKPDIAATKFSRSQSPFDVPADIMLLRNTSTPGNMSFNKFDRLNMPSLLLNFATDNAICGDLQGDGKPELILSRAGTPRNSIHIFKNNSTPGAITFATQQALFMSETNYFATRMGLRDLNNDGKPEIIVTNSFNDVFYVFINQSTGGNVSFTATPLKISIKIAETDQLKTYETDVQDFNGDGLPDIVINQFQNQDLYLLRNISEGSIKFAPPQKLSLPGNFNRLASGDFNGDGLLDLVVTNTFLDRADVLINNSTGNTFSFGTQIQLNTSFEPWGVDIADIDGDNDTDIIIANKNRQIVDAANLKLNIFRNNGSASFTRVDIATTSPTRNVKVNDFDGDGKPDIAYTSFNETDRNSHVNIIRNKNCQETKILNTETHFCNGRSLRLQALPIVNAAFTWTKDAAPFGTGPFVDITAPGTYQVTAVNATDGCTSSASITMIQDTGSAPDLPGMSSNSPLCAGQTLTLTSDAGSAFSRVWTGPNGFSSTQQATSLSNVSVADAGKYTLQVIAANGCKSNVSELIVDISDMSAFQISSPVTGELCAGNSVNLSINNPPNHTFQWKNNGTNIEGQTSSTLNVTSDGSYTVFISNNDITGCTFETLPSDVVMLTKPDALFTAPDPICKDVETAFTNTSTVDERATIVYTWNFDDGSAVSGEESPSHIFTTAGAFDVSLSIQYPGISGCSDNVIVTANVVEPTTPEITASAESACPDGEVNLSIAETFTSIEWTTAETTSSIAVGPGEYGVTALDANGCEGEAAISIATLELPNVTIIAGRTSIKSGDTTQLTASGAAKYVWDSSETLSNDTIANPVASPLETTTYSVTGTATNGCADEADISITVSGTLGFPPAFSPNGDGDNEIWNIRAEGAPDCLLTIFNASGSKIFEKKGENWDGTYDGKVVPSGTYYYVYSCPSEETLTGSVLVFK